MASIVKLISLRVLYGLLVLILVTSGISTLIFMGQVDPARLTFGQRADVKTVEAKRSELGLDDPLHKQLFRYLGDISPIQWIESERLESLPYKYSTILSSHKNKLILKFPDISIKI